MHLRYGSVSKIKPHHGCQSDAPRTQTGLAEELTARLLKMEIEEGIHGQANTSETPAS
jgi:hypothetical protein